MEQLYEAKIEKLIDVVQNDFKLCYEVDTNNEKQILGNIIGDYFYDYENKTKYPILKKLTNGLLDPNYEIKLNVEYATNIRPYTLKEKKKVKVKR